MRDRVNKHMKPEIIYMKFDTILSLVYGGREGQAWNWGGRVYDRAGRGGKDLCMTEEGTGQGKRREHGVLIFVA